MPSDYSSSGTVIEFVGGQLYVASLRFFDGAVFDVKGEISGLSGRVAWSITLAADLHSKTYARVSQQYADALQVGVNAFYLSPEGAAIFTSALATYLPRQLANESLSFPN